MQDWVEKLECCGECCYVYLWFVETRTSAQHNDHVLNVLVLPAIETKEEHVGSWGFFACTLYLAIPQSCVERLLKHTGMASITCWYLKNPRCELQ